MAVPDNPNVMKVAMLFRRDTRIFVNTFHVAQGTVVNLANMTTVAQAFEQWFQDHYRNVVWNGVSLFQIQVRKYDPDDPLALDYDVTPPISGASATSPDTGVSTATLSWRTGLAGRKNRGRDYVVGLTEPAIANDDTLTSPTVTLLGSIGTALLAALSALARSLVIFHKADNTFTTVISVIIDHIVDSMRSRLPGRGT